MNKGLCFPARILTAILLLIIWVLNLTAQGIMNNELAHASGTRLYVVTNRLIDTLPDGNVVFTNQVDTAHRLKYLIVTVEDGNFYTEGCRDLQSMMEHPAPYKDWAVWVHGDGQSFEISLERAAEIQALHQVNLVVFAWPSRAPGMGPVANFKNSLDNARLSVPFLDDLLTGLAKYRKTEFNAIQFGHLSIFFHSLGGYMLNVAVDQGYLKDIPEGSFDNLIINAPATPSEGHAAWVEQLNIQQRIYILFNDGDLNLEGLRVLARQGYQLGERPLAPLSGNAIYLDFTGSVGSKYMPGTTHSYYYAHMTDISQNIRETYTILFQGYPLRFADQTRFEATDNPQVFKVLF